jgi:glycosyltransferase involved in cell wall biosynthesis
MSDVRDRRRHILVTLEALPYPVDPRVRGEVQALLAAGYAVTVVGPTALGFNVRNEMIDGARVLRFRTVPRGQTPLGYFREYGASFAALAWLVRRVHRERQVDLAFVCGPPDLLVALALPLKRAGAAILFDYRELSPELFEAKFGAGGARRRVITTLLRRSERFALQHADAVITVTEPCADLARTRGAVDPKRLFLVGNGPDPNRIYPVAPRPELRGGHEHLVLWLGAMSTQEGLERLIEAADELVNRLGRRDVGFALVGPGDVHDRLRQLIAKRDLSDVIDVRGAVDDDAVRAYISTAAVCVGVDESNSMNDRAGMRKVLEYMAIGRPVVQFPLAEMRRLCGDATVYARNADARDLARKIAWLLDNPEERERIGAAGRDRVLHGLTWPDQVPSLLAAVRSALGDVAVAPPRQRPLVAAYR